MNDKIDIIVPWVDGSDSVWLKEKELWYEKCGKDKKSNSNIRFQSWDNLKYWFRAIEKFMPWVNKICFITWGHLPDFLDISNPKLKIIRHKDYIPEKYLPTYNSNTIEMNYHRIPDLEENFIIFNDDFFPLQPIEEEYYFKNNTVCDEAVEGHIVPVDTGLISNMAKYVQVNNLTIINRYFNKRNVQDKNWDKWFCKDYGELLERNKSLQYWYDFSGFRDPHMASAMKKSTLRRLWEAEKIALDIASKNHFRDYTDVSQYLIRYWQLCEGDFYPRRTLGKFYAVNIENCEEIAKAIERQEWQMISINENCTGEEFEAVKRRINRALEKVLPTKSSYER
jgi:hypothetical protein